MTFVENYQSQGVMIIRNRQHDLLLSFSHFLIDLMIDPDHIFFTNSITVYSLNDSVSDPEIRGPLGPVDRLKRTRRPIDT